jgi:MauM/NapG family ferredoxin protein
MSRRRGWTAARARRLVQLAALALFVALFLAARESRGWAADWAAKLFFLLDPLLLAATFLAAHAVPLLLLVSLATLVATVLLGRVFCGWFCPLGTIHDAAGWVVDRVWPNRKRRDHWSPWQRTKYYLLAAMLVMALLGVRAACVFDPLVLLYRSATTALMPAAQWMIEDSSTAVYQAAEEHVAARAVSAVTEPSYAMFREHVFVAPQQAFLGGGLILAVFVALVAANAFRRRFWCRYLCPLGGLLGWFAWRPWLRRATAQATCNQCDLCAMKCHGAAAAPGGEQWKPAECFGCLNCTDACARESMTMTVAPPWRPDPQAESVDLSKRAMLAAMAGGVVGACMLRITPQGRQRTPAAELIRPPGARPEREFLARCLACGLCMKVCPTGGLQPALFEAGLEGLWTPYLVPRVGYCEYNCNRCGEVCPTEAIEPLTVAAKQQVQIGLAAFDTTRCIPYAYARNCIVCEEHCPIPDKAIYFVEVEVPQRDGGKRTVLQPHIDAEKCIGCGICENKCVFRDQPAVRVRSANETRDPKNRSVLPGETGPY